MRIVSGVMITAVGVALCVALMNSLAESAVPISRDLAADAAAARAQHVPLMLVFAQDHCTFCERLENDVLDPSYKSGVFEGKAVVRKVMIDGYGSVKTINGTKIDGNDVSKRFNVSVVPTVLLVDADGQELAPRIVGYESPEFYGAYFQQALDEARAKVR